MNKAGSQQTKGLQEVREGLSDGACLRKCEELHAATGCEHASQTLECIIHTMPVKVTKGRQPNGKTKVSCSAFDMQFFITPTNLSNLTTTQEQVFSNFFHQKMFWQAQLKLFLQIQLR